MEKNLMNAILAMDSYNRGYTPGVNFGDDPDASPDLPSQTIMGNTAP